MIQASYYRILRDTQCIHSPAKQSRVGMQGVLVLISACNDHAGKWKHNHCRDKCGYVPRKSAYENISPPIETPHSKNYISISFQIEWDMIMVTVFLSLLNQMEVHLVQNRKENCYYDHIPFNVIGIGSIIFSVIWCQDFSCIFVRKTICPMST